MHVWVLCESQTTNVYCLFCRVIDVVVYPLPVGGTVSKPIAGVWTSSSSESFIDCSLQVLCPALDSLFMLIAIPVQQLCIGLVLMLSLRRLLSLSPMMVYSRPFVYRPTQIAWDERTLPFPVSLPSPSRNTRFCPCAFKRQGPIVILGLSTSWVWRWTDSGSEGGVWGDREGVGGLWVGVS